MTREEFRDYVEFLRSQNEISYDVYSGLIDGIDTLEQEPCEDAISKQSVINAIANTCFWLSADNWAELTKCINSLPPVTSQSKTGILDKIRAEIEEIEKNYGLDKATKYGNENAEQQRLSYSTMMMYEVADLVDDIKEIIDKYKAKAEWLTELKKLKEPTWIPVSEGLPKEFSFVNCTCHSLIDDREDWVVETCYVPQPKNSPYSDWGNIPMLNHGECEVVAWMYREIPEPYKAESEDRE